ncbi:hypothetical protein Tco_0810439, partial [Tanacetum coccineum]
STKIAQVVSAWIKSKNSLVKNFEDMRLCRPSKEYLLLEVLLINALRRFRESLRRVTDGVEAFLILTLFILCLDKVSTDDAKLVPLGKVCTAKETLEKNTAKNAGNEDDLTLQMSMIFVISLCQQGGKKKMGESSVKEVPLFDVMLEDKIDTWKQKMLKVKGGKFKKEWEAEEARIEADRILAEKLQEQEREQFTIEERAKFLHDTIAAQRKFPCLNKIRGHKKQTSNKNQLGYQMSDLLIACGDFNILELKSNLTTGLDESKRSEEINNECVTRSMVKEIASKNLDKSAFSVDRDRLRCFHEWKVVSWKLHSSSGVHTLMTDEGLVVHMLIEKKYPLKKEILMQMIKLKLESEEDSTMALELIRFIKKGSQLTLLLGEELASPRSNSSCIGLVPNTNDEELSILEQTATGKGTSNSLIAGSLPKTTKPT